MYRPAYLDRELFAHAMMDITGWFITALSTLFGAPFGFDLLQTVARLKGSGPSPKEKVDGKGAAA